MPNTFGESGESFELLKKYGMTTQDIIRAVKRVMKRR
jgi:transketolase C-terminal domain/subunit